MLNIHEAHMEIFGEDHILGIFGRKKKKRMVKKKNLREGENYLEEKKSRNEGASLLSSNILIIL